MKTFLSLIIIIIIILVIKCKCNLIPIATNVQYLSPVTNIRGINDSIVFVKSNSHTELISSILKNLHSDQSVYIIVDNGYEFKTGGYHNSDPNIIVLTEDLNLDHYKNDSLTNIMFKTHWSTLYLVITDENGNQTCHNGTVSENFLNIADEYMNTIWQHYRIVRAVISFPHTCPNKFIIFSGTRPSNLTIYNRNLKVITANNKKELNNAILDNSRINQLTEGYPLRVNIFSRFPTSITICNGIQNYNNMNLTLSNGFCGMDAMVMHDFIEHYKFNVSIPHDENCNKYGYVKQEPDGASGSLGCIVRNLLDISFNSRFLVLYTTEKFFYLHYVSQDSLCVILRTPDRIPLWHYAYNMFDSITWLMLSSTVITLGLVMWVAAIFIKATRGRKPNKLYTYIINSITGTLFGFLINKTHKTYRILRGTSLVCSIILLAIFQGNVNYRFTTRTRYKDIKTLQGLYQTNNILVTSLSIKNLLTTNVNPEDSLQTSFIQRIQLKDDNVGTEVALQPQLATVVRGRDAQIELLLNYTDDTGMPELYVIEECYHTYYLSFIASTGFLFIEESLIFMMRILEAGLPNMYYVWMQRTIRLGDTHKKTGTEPRPFVKTKMRHLCVAFGILLVGYAISTCVFVIEKYRARRKRVPK